MNIDQMNQIGQAENLDLVGQIGDIYAFDFFSEFDFILMYSMFQFITKDKEKEIGLIKKIVSEIRNGSLIIVCIQYTCNKVEVLNQAINFKEGLNRISDIDFKYIFEDKESGQKFETEFRIVIVKK